MTTASQTTTTIVTKQGDITTSKASAIVNAANAELRIGGGVCGAIYRASGADASLEIETNYLAQQRMTNLNAGEAMITNGYDLAPWIIHTVGPDYRKYNFDERTEAYITLRDAYDMPIILANRLGIKSIAFPLISAGIYGAPPAESAHAAWCSASNYKTNRTAIQTLERIELWAFSDEDFNTLGSPGIFFSD
jgi:O-acetyl-ADP-ribose deacetylase (regulator of RNase III)